MMWKTLIFMAFASVVIAGKIKRNQANYEFYVKHDYDYLKHHVKLEQPEYKKEHYKEVEVPQENNEEGENQEVQEQEGQQEEQGQQDGANEEQQKEQEEQQQQEDNTENRDQQENEGEHSNTETQEPEHHEENEYPVYEFAYKVEDYHTHDIKGHHEKKYGDKVKGAYWLLQPDGYKRTVEYHADKHSGFHANVDFSKSEELDHLDEEHKPKAKSEYYVSTYHGLKKYIPIKEDQEEEQEQDKQEESAQHIPIYVI